MALEQGQSVVTPTLHRQHKINFLADRRGVEPRRVIHHAFHARDRRLFDQEKRKLHLQVRHGRFELGLHGVKDVGDVLHMDDVPVRIEHLDEPAHVGAFEFMRQIDEHPDGGDGVLQGALLVADLDGEAQARARRPCRCAIGGGRGSLCLSCITSGFALPFGGQLFMVTVLSCIRLTTYSIFGKLGIDYSARHGQESRPFLMTKPSLLVLAAGMGSRYGGLKQIDPVGPAGETIIDYSIYDAMRAGFGKLVFVIRRDIEQQFREIVGARFEQRIAGGIRFPGTGQVAARIHLARPAAPNRGAQPMRFSLAEDAIQEPFAAINADDFYGAQALPPAGPASDLRQRRLRDGRFYFATTRFPTLAASPAASAKSDADGYLTIHRRDDEDRALTATAPRTPTPPAASRGSPATRRSR